MLTCGEVMSRSVVCSEAQEIITGVARKMDAARVGSIPVVQNFSTKELVGIITDRDIVIRVVAANTGTNTTRVHEVMTPDIITCNPDDSLETAMARMAGHQVRRIPVVDKQNRIVGIIAQADITRHVDKKSIGILVSEISAETL